MTAAQRSGTVAGVTTEEAYFRASVTVSHPGATRAGCGADVVGGFRPSIRTRILEARDAAMQASVNL